MSRADKDILRPLAEQYRAICANPIQKERRDLWRAHNALEVTRPLIYARAFAWHETPESRLLCARPELRECEEFLRHRLFWASFQDDSIFEPWYPLRAVLILPPESPWGLPTPWIAGTDPRGAKRMDPPIRNPEDAQRLVAPHHRIDEAATAAAAAEVQEALGDVLPVAVDRSPAYRGWNGDISTQLARLRGIEQIMWDMMERPAWLEEVLAFMRNGILRTHKEAEAAGDWCLLAHDNQAMPYANTLPDPAPDPAPVPRAKLWYFCASQETTLIDPARFERFMFAYQRPIMDAFGLVAYGCCEDLTHKMDILRQLPNLRRIAVAPAADVARCAEQIGTDYVISYRPSPSDMVGYDGDPARMRRIMARDLEACRGLHVDVTLKDVETVQGDHARVHTWVRVLREIIETF